MTDNKHYSMLAVLHEINRREMRNKLGLFPEDLRYYATVASSVVGAENAKRIRETPAGVSENSENFVSRLLELSSFEDGTSFSDVLEKYLIETLKDELKFCCLNCTLFDSCLDIENLSVGELFLRRVNGEETAEIREDISREIEKALQNTPYVATDAAHRLCKDFLHQYNTSNVGEVFGRYANIALSLQKEFDLDYKEFLQQMVSVNMTFFEKSSEKTVQADKDL
jgi:hypothetical protein